jgi:hypothetical protein
MFAGTWMNKRGSAMVLEQDGSRISGRYVTRLGKDAVTGDAHPVTGFATGTTIGFVVGWPAADSVTSWVGRVETDGQRDAAHGMAPRSHELRRSAPRAAGLGKFSDEQLDFPQNPPRRGLSARHNCG